MIVILSEVITPSNTRDKPAEKSNDTSTEMRKSYTSSTHLIATFYILGLLNQAEERKDIITQRNKK